MFPALPVGGHRFSSCHVMSGKVRIYGSCIRSYTPGSKENKHPFLTGTHYMTPKTGKAFVSCSVSLLPRHEWQAANIWKPHPVPYPVIEGE